MRIYLLVVIHIPCVLLRFPPHRAGSATRTRLLPKMLSLSCARRSAVRMCGAAVGTDADSGRFTVAEAAGPLSLWHATAADRRVIEERQLEHEVNLLAVGRRCKHGCPQAFAYDSLLRPGAMIGQKGGHKARAKPRSVPCPVEHPKGRASR